MATEKNLSSITKPKKQEKVKINEIKNFKLDEKSFDNNSNIKNILKSEKKKIKIKGEAYLQNDALKDEYRKKLEAELSNLVITADKDAKEFSENKNNKETVNKNNYNNINNKINHHKDLNDASKNINYDDKKDTFEKNNMENFNSNLSVNSNNNNSIIESYTRNKFFYFFY